MEAVVPETCHLPMASQCRSTWCQLPVKLFVAVYLLAAAVRPCGLQGCCSCWPPHPLPHPTRGDVGQHREAHYSRGIRQRLRKMSTHHKWKELYNVSINDMSSFMNDYSDMMARSLFCLVAPGATPRPSDPAQTCTCIRHVQACCADCCIQTTSRYGHPAARCGWCIRAAPPDRSDPELQRHMLRI